MNKILRDLKLAKKLLIGPVAVSLFLLLLAAGTYHGMTSQKAAMDDIYNNRFQGYQNSSEISRSIANVHASLYKVVSWAGANYESAKVEALGKEQKAALERNIAFVQGLQKSDRVTPEEKKLYDATLAQLKAYQEPAVGLLDMVAVDVNGAALFMTISDDKYQELGKTLSSLMDLENRLSRENYEGSIRGFQQAAELVRRGARRRHPAGRRRQPGHGQADLEAREGVGGGHQEGCRGGSDPGHPGALPGRDRGAGRVGQYHAQEDGRGRGAVHGHLQRALRLVVPAGGLH
ncbi:MAG: MCP four helix bundle domain-containing protein [Syntrophaceae bacterium]|nr:MCP four helix bundle domain-containing protein [Syntrophaceae bacterium]